MSDRPWMPLDVDDYMADTFHLSACEHGAYLLLIMRYWKDGGLPDDERAIQKFSRLTPDQWAESRDTLASFFEAGWRHKRIDAELEKASAIIEKRRAAAQARHASSKSDAHAEQVQSKSTYTRVPPVTDNHSSDAVASSHRAGADVRGFRDELSDLDDERLEALVKHRRSKRGQLTGHAARLFRRDAEACGMSIAEATDTCISRNWITVKPDWLGQRQQARGSPTPSKLPSAQELLRNRLQSFADDGPTPSSPRLIASR